MNYIKWVVCWWNKTHVYARFTDRNGVSKYKCVRCGKEG